MNHMLEIESIMKNTSDKYNSGPMKFGICMATYKRRLGTSPGYLKKSLESIMAQTANNWHIYIVGDKYEDNEEFLQCISIVPADKITAINLPVAPERENIRDKLELWKIGGANAFNHANHMALMDDCDYLIHLDDDDTVHPKKIQILNYICSVFDEPSYMFHYSNYVKGQVLPNRQVTTIEPNNILPVCGDTIHSSICTHKSFAEGFKYDSYDPKVVKYQCGDNKLITLLNKYTQLDNTRYGIFIPYILCDHLIEGEMRL